MILHCWSLPERQAGERVLTDNFGLFGFFQPEGLAVHRKGEKRSSSVQSNEGNCLKRVYKYFTTYSIYFSFESSVRRVFRPWLLHPKP